MSAHTDVSTKLGLGPTASDAAIVQKLFEFQQNVGLRTSGLPNPQTLAALELYDPMDHAPRAFKQGKKPGTLGRDVTTSMNQIPMWAWIAMGAGCLGLAYFGWRQQRRKA